MTLWNGAARILVSVVAVLVMVALSAVLATPFLDDPSPGHGRAVQASAAVKRTPLKLTTVKRTTSLKPTTAATGKKTTSLKPTTAATGKRTTSLKPTTAATGKRTTSLKPTTAAAVKRTTSLKPTTAATVTRTTTPNYRTTTTVDTTTSLNPRTTATTSPILSADARIEAATTLTCTADAMRIHVNLTEVRVVYGDTAPDHLSLQDEGCTGVTVGDTWVLENPHSQCYTQTQMDNDTVRYTNALVYKEHESGPIVRHHRWRLDLSCNFRRNVHVNLNYGLTKATNYSVSLKSDYSATIHLFSDPSLTTELKASQARARLGDDLFVKIQLSGHWNVRMRLHDCVARPEPQSHVAYTLIQNGCVVDSETSIVFSSRNVTVFHFKAFEFYSGYSSVYLYCDVIYCDPSDIGHNCSTSCN